MFKNFFVRQISARIQLVFQLMLVYSTMMLMTVYTPRFLRLMRRYAARMRTYLTSANPVAIELQQDANYCYMLSWILGVEVHGQTAPTNFVDEYLALIDPAIAATLTRAAFWDLGPTDPDYHDQVYGEFLESYLMRYLTDDKVAGWDILALDRNRDPSLDMFSIAYDPDNTILLNNDTPVLGDLMLTPGLLLIIGTHRSGKTSLLDRMPLFRSERGIEVALPPPAHTYDITRLVVQEPDAISGKVPLEPASVFTLVRNIEAITNNTVLVDSLTAIQEQVDGVLKTGGINFGVFEYIDSLVQLSYHHPFVISMSFEANELQRFYEKFRGRVPNILISNSPGRAELFCRGSFPNPHDWNNGIGNVDRLYTITVTAPIKNLIHNF